MYASHTNMLRHCHTYTHITITLDIYPTENKMEVLIREQGTVAVSTRAGHTGNKCLNIARAMLKENVIKTVSSKKKHHSHLLN